MSLFKELSVKPWERKGIIGGLTAEGTFDTSPQKVALVFFVVVASVVFSLFTVSYIIRMELPDWAPMSEPTQLWFNTGLLVLSSVFFQWARNISKTESDKNVKTAFMGAGLFAIFFIIGQYMTWEALLAEGFYMSSDPATAFYYLLTGVHAVHLLGGLWVWSTGLIRIISGVEPKELKLSIELCAFYWHFLLIIWLIMFALMANT
ncbi:MAG: cytochrome c oxidase subunit 3 [Pseudohongiellaceae bacterium]